MNTEIIKELAQSLKIKEINIIQTLNLLSEGNTIPFISRYRKEVTGSLNEDEIRAIDEKYKYQLNLENRKSDIIRLIEEKGLITEELINEINKCTKLVEIEDIYRPFKEKKKTKATEAISQGLEPLANWILNLYPNGNIEVEASKYLNNTIKTIESAIEGAKYIIAEIISDNSEYRKWIRSYIYNNAILDIAKKKNAIDENKTYEMYYSYSEKVSFLKPHRILAFNRGEKEKILSVKLTFNKEIVIDYLIKSITKEKESTLRDIIIDAIEDSFKRLIFPSIEREIRNDLTEKAEDKALIVFSMNLEKLLLTPPLKDKMILGFDPAFRTGCKLAVLDKTGKMLDISVIYPHEPKNEIEKAKKKILDLISQYNIDIIAIGNGTASRESEMFVANTIKYSTKKVEYIIVSEAGASVYSASPLAKSEFPNLAVEERSAISIGRRVQDPLSELVKIDTKSIGIGQYQHDISEKKLNESLDFIVTKVVNQVGININTASASILKYISGLNKKNIDNLITYRENNGKIKSREEITKIKGISEKSFIQSAGFMRILDGSNPLDKTSIHPESYEKTLKILENLNIDISEIGSNSIKEKLDSINDKRITEELSIDKYTLEDIIKSLKEPLMDPRDNYPQPILKSDILTIEDLKIGMKLQGTVRNVVDFGVFIDIGLKNDGLAHISKLTTNYIKHPLEVVNVGEIVDCYVDDVMLEKKKVALSLIEPK